MSQTRTLSAVEAAANVVIGYGFAILVQMAVFPVYGLDATVRQHLGIGAVFTLVSFLRGYLLRRLFNRAARTGGDM